MRETETFDYIRRKYLDKEEKWRKVTQLVKFDENLEVKSVHDFNINCYISTFGRLIRNGILCNMAYGDKYDISCMFTDTDGNQVRFMRHQIVMQTFFMGDRRRYDTVDHINNVERFDNSIYNLRWADKGKREYQYLYSDGDLYNFMDTETFEQIALSAENVGDSLKFVKENEMVKLCSHNGNVFSIEPPITVELQITESEPGVKGDTATGATKPAILETGAKILVPLFVNQGDTIKIDTRTGEYISRV